MILEALTKISGVLVEAFGQGYLLVLGLALYSLVKAAVVHIKKARMNPLHTNPIDQPLPNQRHRRTPGLRFACF